MRAPRDVVIVGSGSAAWLCALALHRAFAATGLTITVVDVPEASPLVGATACPPGLRRLHRRIGIPDGSLPKHIGATVSLGQEYRDWSGDGTAFLHVHGETGRPIAGLPFLPFWCRARATDIAAPLEDFAPAAIAARAGRADTTLPHGYHLPLPAYAALLARYVATTDIAVVRSADIGVETGVTGIAALLLSDGRRITGDLFIDASGPAARLIGTLDSARDVAPSLPCTRMATVSVDRAGPALPYARCIAHHDGWAGAQPLADRTAWTIAYGAELSDEAAVQRLATLAGGPLHDGVELLPIRYRLRPTPWIGNCIGIGQAACDGDTIDTAILHREQMAVTQLVTLFPVDRDAMVEAAIYNGEVVARYHRLFDVQALHYRLNRRFGQAFWDDARERPVSSDLAAAIVLFAARGLPPSYNHDALDQDGWQAMLIGHGVIPRSYDPQADRCSSADMVAALDAIRADMPWASAIQPRPAGVR